MSQEIVLEAEKICRVLRGGLPNRWNGKDCILELKSANYQWKQMEWIGWYFEYKATNLLKTKYGSRQPPSFGSTRFDFKLDQVWDFKAHPINSSTHPWVIVNDKEAIDNCIISYGGVGVVIAEGKAEYDDTTESFKQWHNSLKGGRSDYEKERIKRGAPSRKRKKAFELNKLEAVWFEKKMLSNGLERGWISHFQNGMRNADGSSRRAKYLVDISRIPTESKLVKI